MDTDKKPSCNPFVTAQKSGCDKYHPYVPEGMQQKTHRVSTNKHQLEEKFADHDLVFYVDWGSGAYVRNVSGLKQGSWPLELL